MESTLTFKLSRKLKLPFRELYNFRKLRITLIKKITFFLRLRLDHTPQSIVILTHLKISMSTIRLIQNNLPLFCFRDL